MSRKSAEPSSDVLRGHKRCEIGHAGLEFDTFAELQTEKDSVAERAGFEPSRPFISHMLP